MKVATISQTKNNLSKYLDAVKRGESVIIIDRDKAIAKIEPIYNSKEFQKSNLLTQLEREGIIKRAQIKPLAIKISQIPKPSKKVSISEILIKERQDSR